MNVRRIANTSLLISLALYSASFATAQAGGQPSLADLRAACADDAKRLCAGVQSGGGRIVACLKEHKDSLSDRCKQVAGLATKTGSTPSAPENSAIGRSPASTPGAASKPNPPHPDAKANLLRAARFRRVAQKSSRSG